MKIVSFLLTLVVVLVTSPITSMAQQGADPTRPGAREEINYDVPDEADIDYEALDSIDISQSEFGVVPLPENVGATLNGLFTKYTKHVAPNGKPIHIFGQPRVSDLQMARAREILKYHLTDVPDTKYGVDKTAIANQMGDVRATLTYTDTQAMSFAMRSILRGTELSTQDLYATESPVEGSYTYIHNQPPEGDFFTRDASYEEIMHLVHGKGIDEALPAYAEEIATAEKRAIAAEIYRYGGGRLAPHEYIIAGFDIYFGLWEHDPQGDGTSFGNEVDVHTREEMKVLDRPLYDVVHQYWPKYLTYIAYIDPSFEGTFTTVRDPKIEYTLKSRYLVNITLTGDKDTNILGNDQENQLNGNSGNNTITGREGNDLIDGGDGDDTAVFSSYASQYKVTTSDGKTIVTDTFPDRDGTDELTNIEHIKFIDEEIDL